MINFDLYIHVNDFDKLEKGDSVIGYRKVSNVDNYELVPSYAFNSAIQINDNEYKVTTINN